MKVLCLGDSLTYGYGLPRDQIWTALAAAGTGVEFVNRALNGNTTGGMLAALHREMEAASPDAVVLMGGSNDIIYGGDIGGAKSNLGAMVHIASAACVLPILGTPLRSCPPIRTEWAAMMDGQETEQMIDVYAQWIRRLSRTFRLPLIDFYQTFPQRIIQHGWALRDCYMEDGLHPNSRGHSVMAEIAAETIMALQNTPAR